VRGHSPRRYERAGEVRQQPASGPKHACLLRRTLEAKPELRGRGRSLGRTECRAASPQVVRVSLLAAQGGRAARCYAHLPKNSFSARIAPERRSRESASLSCRSGSPPFCPVGLVAESFWSLRGGLLERILELFSLILASRRAGRIGLAVHSRLQDRIARNAPYAAWRPTPSGVPSTARRTFPTVHSKSESSVRHSGVKQQVSFMVARERSKGMRRMICRRPNEHHRSAACCRRCGMQRRLGRCSRRNCRHGAGMRAASRNGNASGSA